MKVDRQIDQKLDLCGGASSDSEETLQLALGAPAKSFGDVCPNRHSRPLDLTLQTPPLTAGQQPRESICLSRKLTRTF